MLTVLPEIDPLLEARLSAVARQRREVRLHRLSAYRWGTIAAIAAGLLVLRWTAGVGISWAFPFLGVLMTVAVIWNWRNSRRAPLDLEEAARVLEARHPELQLALQTALEQRAEAGQFTFLQRRVIQRALQHADQHDWDQPDPARARWKILHVAAMGAAFGLLIGIIVSEKAAPGRPVRISTPVTLGITVTPGTAEVERRSIVVVTARFGGALPKEVRLVWQAVDGEKHTTVMAKSLSDPIFAFSLPPLLKDVTYQISYDNRATDSFQLTVFDLPALVRSDAALTYPSYTGLAPRTIAETRRVSAVEGTDLTYDFSMNKPVRRAVLREADGTEVELTAANPERTRFTTSFKIEKSRRFALRLEDQKGRVNRAPEEIRIEAVANKVPEVRWIAPVGDPRVSPIEEVQLQAEARDDFGLVDYGVAFSFGDGEPEYVSLRSAEPRVIEAKFNHRLALEARKVEPRQLVTWFAWADDYGPDGASRRTTGDLHFADVRPLDEIFREDDSGGASQSSQQQGAGQQNQELIELQRQISIALWKLKQSNPKSEKRKEDLGTLEESQRNVRQRLQGASEQIKDPQQKSAAEKAKTFMDRALERMEDAVKQTGAGPLTAAWTNAQGAYQELLKMQPKENRVAQGNSRSGGGQRGNQRQLNQLDFKQAENRYETETEAQPMATPQQREQLQVLSKLRELARRQQEVNQRLQELQTALTSAQDEEQREQVRRELKRLEEEQRRMLADTDELRERMDRLQPGEQNQQARQQLEQTREDMRRAGERLERGEISPALASGSRAAEGLEQMRENFRRESSNQFSQQLREARRQARELGEKQKVAEEKLNNLAGGTARSLDDSSQREEIARTFEEEQTARENLLKTLQQVAEESETSEPGLHRRLYDLLRQQGQSQAGEQLQAGAEMVRRGFIPQAQDAARNVGRDLQQLQNGVERAAESVLGDEAAELRYAQRELDDLSKQLQGERPVSEESRPADGNGASGEKSENDSSATSRDRVPGQGEKRLGSSVAQSDPQNPGGRPPTPSSESRSQGSTPAGTEGSRGRPSARGTGTSERSSGERENADEQSNGSALAENESSNNPASPSGSSAQASSERRGGAGQGDQPNRTSGRAGSPGRRAGGSRAGGAGSGMESLIEELSQQATAGSGERPLTGEGFNDWFERLRTVEELTQLPEARQRLASAREQAEALRRDFKRHSKEPRWSSVESGIATPLSEARLLLRQELARRENPEALQPVDRDPVPDRYAESVRKYYEALGR